MCGTEDELRPAPAPPARSGPAPFAPVPSQSVDVDLEETLVEETLMEETLLDEDSEIADAAVLDEDEELAHLPFSRPSARPPVAELEDEVPGATVPTLGSQELSDNVLPFDPVDVYKAETEEFEEALFHDAPGFVPIDEGAAPTEEKPPLESAEGTLLKQDGKVYHVRNLATIQRWIVERRVMREDLISSGGMRWEPVGHHPDLEIFFQMVERLDDLELAQRLGQHDTRPPLDEDVPMGNQWDEPEEEEELDAVHEEDIFGTLDEEGLEEPDEGDEEEQPGLLAEVSEGEVDELDAEPSEVSSVSVDYASDFDDEAWRDAPSTDTRGEKPDTLYVARNLAQHPTLAPMEEVMATEAVSVAVSAPDPIPRPIEDTAASNLDEDFRQHFDSAVDDISWNEEAQSRRAVIAAVSVVVVLLLLGVAWALMRPPVAEPVAQVDPPVEQPDEPPADVDEPPVEEPPAEVVEEPPVEEPPAEVVEEPPPKEATPKKDPPKKDPPKKAAPKAPPAGNASALSKKGWHALGQGDLPGAREFFVDALASNPRYADAHYGLGYTAATQGDSPTAIRHYCKALENGRGNLEIERDVPPLLKQVGGSCE